MTTFTPLPLSHSSSSTERATISIHPSRRLSKINRNIYSGFTEHMGRCIYGGIYDPDNPNTHLIDSSGFRTDVLAALTPLNIPVIRYPGGNFCATYHWLDGVGPVSQRPTRPDLAWGHPESNRFGTDEFMAWCRKLGAEPYLCLNFGTGTLDEALNWLEYCNGSGDTYYANLRRKNGHAEPYKVTYWALGNEMWGPWQVGQMTEEDYAKRAKQWGKALKLLDPSVELVLCGKEGATSWDYHVLRECLRPAGEAELEGKKPRLAGMHSIHLYTASEEHYENVTAPLAAERAIEVCSGLIDLASIENGVTAADGRPTICFDEWNVWDPKRAVGSRGAEERYTLSDALAVATWLNVFVRKSKEVGMACLAQSVNVISPLMTTKEGIVKQTTWFPYELFCKYMKGWTVACHLECGAYEGPTKPAWVRGVRETPWLDASATVDEQGWVSVCVVNIHKEAAIEATLGTYSPWKNSIASPDNFPEMGDSKCAANIDVHVYTVSSSCVDDTNMDGNQEVAITESIWKSREEESKFRFPKHSITMLRWKT
jgi:alpha-N-arabinofuranosidase